MTIRWVDLLNTNSGFGHNCNFVLTLEQILYSIIFSKMMFFTKKTILNALQMHNNYVLYHGNFLVVHFHLMFVVILKIKSIYHLTCYGSHFEWPKIRHNDGNSLDFGHRLLIFLILVAFWLRKSGQICDFRPFSWERKGNGLKFGMLVYSDHLNNRL